jgi:hypothetical protein
MTMLRGGSGLNQVTIAAIANTKTAAAPRSNHWVGRSTSIFPPRMAFILGWRHRPLHNVHATMLARRLPRQAASDTAIAPQNGFAAVLNDRPEPTLQLMRANGCTASEPAAAKVPCSEPGLTQAA